MADARFLSPLDTDGSGGDVDAAAAAQKAEDDAVTRELLPMDPADDENECGEDGDCKAMEAAARARQALAKRAARALQEVSRKHHRHHHRHEGVGQGGVAVQSTPPRSPPPQAKACYGDGDCVHGVCDLSGSCLCENEWGGQHCEEPVKIEGDIAVFEYPPQFQDFQAKDFARKIASAESGEEDDADASSGSGSGSDPNGGPFSPPPMRPRKALVATSRASNQEEGKEKGGRTAIGLHDLSSLHHGAAEKASSGAEKEKGKKKTTPVVVMGGPEPSADEIYIEHLENTNLHLAFIVRLAYIIFATVIICIACYLVCCVETIRERIMMLLTGDTKLRMTAGSLISEYVPGASPVAVRISEIKVYNIACGEWFGSPECYINIVCNPNMPVRTRVRKLKMVWAVPDPLGGGLLPEPEQKAKWARSTPEQREQAMASRATRMQSQGANRSGGMFSTMGRGGAKEGKKISYVEWNERLEVNINPMMGDDIQIQVKEQDFVSDDTVGELRMTSSKVLEEAKKENQKMYSLRDDSGKECGHIQLRIDLIEADEDTRGMVRVPQQQQPEPSGDLGG